MSAAASPLYVIPPAPLKGKYNSPRARTHPHFEFPSERWVNLGTFLVKKDSFPGPVVEKDFSSRTGAKPELGLPDFMRSLSQGPFCPLLSCSSVLPITDRRAQERRGGAALWKFLEIGCPSAREQATDRRCLAPMGMMHGHREPVRRGHGMDRRTTMES